MLQVTVTRKVGNTVHQMQVQLPGYDRLTPKAARGALEVAFGQPYDGTVWFNGDVANNYAGSYGYRVYPRSARKVYPDFF